MTPTPVDLFAEEITYNGPDISRIDQIGSCTAGLIRNRYSYDADHRLTQLDNTLFNPYEVPWGDKWKVLAAPSFLEIEIFSTTLPFILFT